MRAPLLLTAALAALMLSACAAKPPADDPDAVADFKANNYPLEPTNRVFFTFNDKLDTYALKPVAQGYVFITPAPVRSGIHNALGNLASPALLFNDVAEGHPRNAGTTFMRFMINSTIGGLGTFDVAKSLGYPGHGADGNLTLALWGVPEGPYLYVPFLGPSSPRGLAGDGIDAAANPFTYAPHGYGLHTFSYAKSGLGIVDQRALLLTDLDKAKAGALDPYATFRTLYQQYEHKQIADSAKDSPATPPAWSPN